MKISQIIQSISILMFTLIGADCAAQDSTENELRKLENLGKNNIRFYKPQSGSNQSSGNWIVDGRPTQADLIENATGLGQPQLNSGNWIVDSKELPE